MTAKEKAIKLFNSYVKILPIGSNVERAKQYALIAVDEILKVIPKNNAWQTSLEYWQEVKQEIDKL